MAETETKRRQVVTEFTARDAGHGAVVSALAKAYETSTRKLDAMRSKFGEFRKETGMNLAATLGVGVGLGAMIAKAKEAQAEFGRTQKGIAGLLSSSLKFDRGTSELDKYNRSLQLSREITNDLDAMSARFVVSMDEVGNTYRQVAASAGGMGLTQRQVMDLTESAIATAKRFGVSGETAAMSIARALEKGAVRGFDPFNVKLRQAVGDMKKLTAAQRFEHIEKALKGSVAIADAMSGGVGGALSRIHNTVEDLFRDASGPLFKEVAKTLESWAKHLREAKEQGQPLIDVYGGRLVEGFKLVKDVSATILSHWKAIALVWAGFKGAQLATGLAGAASGAAAAAGAGGAAAGAGLGGKLLGAGAAVAGTLFATTYAERQAEIARYAGMAGQHAGAVQAAEAFAKAKADIMAFKAQHTAEQIIADSGVNHAARGLREVYDAAKSKLGQALGAVDDNALEAAFKISADVRAGLAARENESASALGMSADRARQAVEALEAGLYKDLAGVTGDKKLAFAKSVIQNNFHGGIKVEIKAEDPDPDRIFVRFEQGLFDMVDRRSQALGAEPQGD
jgi:hypothetical protein